MDGWMDVAMVITLEQAQALFIVIETIWSSVAI